MRKFPEPVQDHMGYALYVAQRGGKHRDTKTLSGFGGAGVVAEQSFKEWWLEYSPLGFSGVGGGSRPRD